MRQTGPVYSPECADFFDVDMLGVRFKQSPNWSGPLNRSGAFTHKRDPHETLGAWACAQCVPRCFRSRLLITDY